MRLALVLVSASLLTAGAAGAQTIRLPGGAGDSRVQTVGYGELDLSSHTGRLVLLNRLKQAADVACDGAPSRLAEFVRWELYRKCVASTINSGLDQVAPSVASRPPVQGAPVVTK